MRHALRQIKQANERKAKALVAHPEVRFMLQTLMGLHQARKANDEQAFERIMVEVNSYCQQIESTGEKPLP